MPLTILGKGPSWTTNNRAHRNVDVRPGDGNGAQSARRRPSNRFREIAEQYGSHAVWLPDSGFLVTEDLTEEARHFPYEQWRDQALRETGHEI